MMPRWGYWPIVRPDGSLDKRWESLVPRVSDRFLASVIFLYSSEEDAQRGPGAGGGSGFIIGVKYVAPVRRWHYYLVTNKHVVERGGLWARVGTYPGSVETHETALDDWERDQQADVAVCRFEPPEEWNFACVASTTLLTAQQISEWGIGVGDDVFVSARLLGFEGHLLNTPVLHTGAIAMMSGDPVTNPETGQQERGYLVEIHSRGGFSGSPVFGFLSPKQYQLGGPPREEFGEVGYLLGIIWANISEKYPVLSKDSKPTGEHVWIPRGVAGVIPAARIQRLLDRDRFALQRPIDERTWMDQHPEPESGIELLHGDDETTPDHTADLLGKLLQVPKDEADEAHRRHGRKP
jgi:hypothetical protein